MARRLVVGDCCLPGGSGLIRRAPLTSGIFPMSAARHRLISFGVRYFSRVLEGKLWRVAQCPTTQTTNTYSSISWVHRQSARP
jgi:hypothetical protein